jgi:3-keto-disaccharide hydrolase
MLSKIGALAVACLPLAACSQSSEPATESVSAGAWTTLFDGASLDGWTPVGDANWQLGDGAVNADTGTGFLLTNASYADFDLELEFWVSPDANSGVFIRCANPAAIGAATCYEVNIFDRRPDPAYRTGAIVEVAKPAVSIDTGDRWNTYAISARGKRLKVTLNGQSTVDVEDDRFAAGPIALQYGAGRVMFRNVRIRAN